MDETVRIARCAGAEDERETLARGLFRAGWDVPRDTYITDGFPMLLYRLSKIPGVNEREAPDADDVADSDTSAR